MKKYLVVFLLFFISCESNVDLNENIDLAKELDDKKMQGSDGVSNAKLILEGNFQNSGRYQTSGKAKIYEDKDQSRYLVIENLKSDPGPDLRIYIAKDAKATGFIELSSSVQNGNRTIKLPATADISQQNFILIWCKRFSVPFGHAELK